LVGIVKAKGVTPRTRTAATTGELRESRVKRRWLFMKSSQV
jgi:hypothetical protein